MENILLPNLAFKLYKKELAPKKPSVYMFHNAQTVIIYVGMANNLKQRLNAHFSKSQGSNTKDFMDEVAFISYYDNEDVEIIKYLEKVYIQIHNDTIYNKMLNPNKDGINLQPIPIQKMSPFDRFLDSLTLEDVLHKRPPVIFEKFLVFIKTDYTVSFDYMVDGTQFKRPLRKEIMNRFNLCIKDKWIDGKTKKVYCNALKR
ncbi:GIY-YIG nuclease family protein [Neobacillus vireti]|uniref:Excinuclease ABC subunit C n=1 Tax=Neobacillus vireti LMG 21834 TaxID=1131730 RepID=A0AB94IJM6_9BACI|nr:GIY-YIG nuclease family protein [Neobacillus vireti]ETI67259.1 excinuclease ABC subunit C [Neobacillus vireti LMG 21834]KLT19654.1 hypothetical protein AA980_03425 [Neobacillus vireti]